ncbi:unnamed protein product [Kuraishia capsulata CBS 1993]|uniref:Glycogen debranching enzyme n=1 Tax=Kuraishia capsulata CBS 1993 TaxID=1382522 RepID=W6MVH6_9ASCO|nr:uncharacterized protein KUCA_T00002261001 [Kuraishia capsulata CBS 1993]CDK26290.1 unnamed protein product [Kuraishia capsulata CBS 1993]
MSKIVLLRLSDNGEPLVNNSNGVLGLPASPPPKDWKKGDPIFTLRLFIAAGSKITNKGHIWTDMPPDSTSGFSRSKFYSHSIDCSAHKDSTIDLPIYTAGSYCYYVAYHSIENEEESQKLTTTRKTHFVVPPSLSINGEFLPLNAITLQSVVSKWVGKDLEKDWEPLFAHVKSKGYNMIHFTPLQVRGESNSPYSIYDQLSFDADVFKGGVDEVRAMTQKLQKEHGILSMTDMVWNHTANNSDWLRENPEAGYNQETAPHLEAAIVLDKSLLHFSKYMKWHGYPTDIRSTSDLLKIMDGIKIHVLGDLKLWQYYVLNVQQHLEELEKAWSNLAITPTKIPEDVKNNLKSLSKFVVQLARPQGFELSSRNANKLDIYKFASVLRTLAGEDADFSEAKSHAHKILDEINLPLYKAYDEDNSEILEQVYNRIKYLRLEDNGPKLGPVTEYSPLTEPYFTRFEDASGKEWALANNGWIWGGNPLVDFASSQSKAYLRREVIIWGDCVKLRYGKSPEDSPALWERMTKYTQLSASIFDGFRIDNCHSTPLHVGEALLDIARKTNPNLYVVAELFTGDENIDVLFMERLGISSIIREAMQAYSVGELSRLVHMHGGKPIGSLQWLPLDELAITADRSEFSKRSEENINNVSELPVPEMMVSQPPHALFMDCTHDNEMPNDKRTVEDTLPNAALVALCSCATGTVFGYDECYPHLLDVVHEKRLYNYEDDMGISSAKKILNGIRTELAEQTKNDVDQSEVHIHHEGQYIILHRLNSKTGKGYFLVARTKFVADGNQVLAPIYLSGIKATPAFSYTLSRTGDAPSGSSADERILPVPVELTAIQNPEAEFDEEKNETVIRISEYFPQGSIAILNTEIAGCDDELDKFVRSGAIAAAEKLSLIDLNAILYKCESEERDASAGTDGVYNVPNYGHLVYAGLQGWISASKDAIKGNDLAHPLVEHLRSGSWACDYVVNRLDKYSGSEGVKMFQDWLRSRLQRIKQVPFFLLPRYFLLVIGIAYEALRFTALSLMTQKLQESTAFVQSLAMCSVQMVGSMRTASLNTFEIVPSLAAGLPHFSYDFMRCWGRDVFLALRGLLIATGRFDEAKSHILNFAMTLKHGLIPNLLGSGKDPRYNARDAAWFFLQSIQEYANFAPDGDSILNETVKRRFLPFDDTYFPQNDPRAFSQESTLEEIIYEILARHAKGISYREANAGPNLDSQMRDEGFNVNVHVDWTTGLVHGGNQFNCGTWMDKMGESTKAGNKGIPGTPRDGAAIEINGLLKSALRFVNALQDEKKFKYTDVEKQDGTKISLKDWEALLQENFERCYYIPEDPGEDQDYDVNPDIVNRRGIYKDLYKSGKPYEDYQLRGNFPIAMVVAPELFDPEKAFKSIQKADTIMRGPIGLKTLDPSDLNYRPFYNNSEDSEDFATSKGRNYHQGPEWCWILGFYLRAFKIFYYAQHPECSTPNGKAADYLHQLLSKRMIAHRDMIQSTVWAGLTELTNENGAYCADSSPTQAWSASCLLDLFCDQWEDEGFK